MNENYLRKGYRDYLEKSGYSLYTPSGNPSTVFDYDKRIEWVCEQENCSWAELKERIGSVVAEYDVGGKKELDGERSHRAVISALRAFQRYIKNQAEEEKK